MSTKADLYTRRESWEIEGPDQRSAWDLVNARCPRCNSLFFRLENGMYMCRKRCAEIGDLSVRIWDIRICNRPAIFTEDELIRAVSSGKLHGIARY